MEEINPYAAPQTELVRSESRPVNSLRMLDWFAWATVFALNLIVPVLGGMQVLRNPWQWTSMFAGIVCVFLLSCWKIARAPQYYAEWMKNGLIMALSQLIPMLQVVVGIVADLIAKLIEQYYVPNYTWQFYIQTWSGGFIATLMMGLMMTGIVGLFSAKDYHRQRRMQSPKVEL